jgi:hypothetical protein
MERRDTQRIWCDDLHTSTVFFTQGSDPMTMDYVNISARGWCGFYVGDQPPGMGDVIYLIRKGLRRVYYQVCWCREVSEDAYRAGFKVLDSGHTSLKNPIDVMSLCQGKYAKRKYRGIGVGLT